MIIHIDNLAVNNDAKGLYSSMIFLEKIYCSLIIHRNASVINGIS